MIGNENKTTVGKKRETQYPII